MTPSAKVWFITHPEVVVDPARPVPDWELSSRGRARLLAMLGEPWLRQVRSVHSSVERKAVEVGKALADSLGQELLTWPALHEHDRSATGFLPPPRYDELVERFFAEPEASVCGWETAAAAQARIVGAVASVLRVAPDGHVAIVAHGGVGTLLLCRLGRVEISRRLDQPHQGHRFAFARQDWSLISGWQPI